MFTNEACIVCNIGANFFILNETYYYAALEVLLINNMKLFLKIVISLSAVFIFLQDNECLICIVCKDVTAERP